jgi:hypothetical protein
MESFCTSPQTVASLQVSQTEFGQTKRQISAASGNTDNAPATKRPKA